MPIEKQVEEANAAGEVRLSSSRVFKNSNGMIMTEYSFDVLQSYNLSEDDIEGKVLKLTAPGGTYEGVTSMIDGAPDFQLGEQSFLLLKKIESKIYLSNFTLGKYKIQSFGGAEYYVSEVFPQDPQMGKIAKSKMIELMKNSWKISSSYKSESQKIGSQILKENNSQDVATISFDERRNPAQVDAKEEGTPLFFWSAIALVVFFFSLIFIKLGQSEHQHKCE
jgi:hypothetical protein